MVSFQCRIRKIRLFPEPNGPRLRAGGVGSDKERLYKSTLTPERVSRYDGTLGLRVNANSRPLRTGRLV